MNIPFRVADHPLRSLKAPVGLMSALACSRQLKRPDEATFSTSPLLCRTLMAAPQTYGSEMRRLGVPMCKNAFPDKTTSLGPPLGGGNRQ